MTTQNAAILAHLRSGATLTPLDALRLYGCARLAARCLELRRQGHKIETHTVRRGRVAYAEYRLPQGQAAEPSDRGAASASPASAPYAAQQDQLDSPPAKRVDSSPAVAAPLAKQEAA